MPVVLWTTPLCGKWCLTRVMITNHKQNTHLHLHQYKYGHYAHIHIHGHMVGTVYLILMHALSATPHGLPSIFFLKHRIIRIHGIATHFQAQLIAPPVFPIHTLVQTILCEVKVHRGKLSRLTSMHLSLNRCAVGQKLPYHCTIMGNHRHHSSHIG